VRNPDLLVQLSDKFLPARHWNPNFSSDKEEITARQNAGFGGRSIRPYFFGTTAALHHE